MFWAVVWPLQRQWDGQRETLIQYAKDIKFCDQLVIERPQWPLTKNCYEQAAIRERNALEFWSFRHTWVLPRGVWLLFLVLSAFPPLVTYGMALLGMWIWRGSREARR